MARMPRLVVPGYPHHVTQRGNRRQETFFCEDDYLYYINLLSESAGQAGTEIWAYCLMPNHVHLVMVPSTEDGLRATLGEAHRHYTRHINFRQGWRGHLWQERFHSFLMDEDYLLATVRYVERNPVAARLCRHPGEWPWSSTYAHLKGVDDILVTVKPMLDRVPDWEAYLSSSTHNDKAEAIQQHNRTGRPLGSTRFIQLIELQTGKALTPKRPGPKPSSTN
jgi:putative transposase